MGLFVPTGGFDDIRFHGAVALVLAGMAFLGWLGKRKQHRTFKIEKARQEERDARMEQLLKQQVKAMQQAGQIACPACHRVNPAGTRFCGTCGVALTA